MSDAEHAALGGCAACGKVPDWFPYRTDSGKKVCSRACLAKLDPGAEDGPSPSPPSAHSLPYDHIVPRGYLGLDAPMRGGGEEPAAPPVEILGERIHHALTTTETDRDGLPMPPLAELGHHAAVARHHIIAFGRDVEVTRALSVAIARLLAPLCEFEARREETREASTSLPKDGDAARARVDRANLMRLHIPGVLDVDLPAGRAGRPPTGQARCIGALLVERLLQHELAEAPEDIACVVHAALAAAGLTKRRVPADRFEPELRDLVCDAKRLLRDENARRTPA